MIRASGRCHTATARARSVTLPTIRPGYAQWEATPIGSVNGSVPTPFGQLRLSVDVDMGQHSVFVPQGTEARVSLPIPLADSAHACVAVAHYTVDGVARVVNSSTTRQGFCSLQAITLAPGEHSITVVYSSRQVFSDRVAQNSRAPFGPPQWVRLLAIDNSSGGDWVGKYGQSGFVIFGGKPQETIEHLPEWAAWSVGRTYRNMSLFAPNRGTYLNTAGDRRALQDPSNHTNRVLGWWSPGGQQTGFVDLTLTAGRNVTVSVYSVDFDNPQPLAGDWPPLPADQGPRWQALLFYDLVTLRQLAPIVIQKDFGGGMWVTFVYDRSVRIRVPRIAGKQSQIAGIFLGPATDTGTG